MTKWFKFYGQDYLTDPKIQALNCVERTMWITILCLASNTDDGVIKNIDTEEVVARIAGLDPRSGEWGHSLDTFKKLCKLEMIKIEKDKIIVINYLKRQNTNLTDYERVKRHRQVMHVINDNAKHVINAPHRIDKRREDKKRITASSDDADDITKVFNVFYYSINPTINFGHKTNRKAIKDMIKAFGLKETIKQAEFAVSTNGKKFAPVITTPYQLKEKWAMLETYKKTNAPEENKLTTGNPKWKNL